MLRLRNWSAGFDGDLLSYFLGVSNVMGAHLLASIHKLLILRMLHEARHQNHRRVFHFVRDDDPHKALAQNFCFLRHTYFEIPNTLCFLSVKIWAISLRTPLPSLTSRVLLPVRFRQNERRASLFSERRFSSSLSFFFIRSFMVY